MKKLSKPLVVIASTLGLVLGVAACGGGSVDGTAGASGSTTPTEATAASILIDVRTPEEFSAGHVQGARNLDLTGGAFEAALPGLDPGASYVLYCRSGNRSAQAAALMASAGFTTVSDLGSLEDAASQLALPIVTG
jgi:rhodanese-related sulfurtransferase